MNSNNISRSNNIHYNYINVIIYLIIFLALGLAILYLWNYYQQLKNILTITKPLLVSDCPDYWESIGNGKCQNVNYLGSCANVAGNNIVDFSGDLFNNMNVGNYAKCKWATSCNTSWSGVDRLC